MTNEDSIKKEVEQLETKLKMIIDNISNLSEVLEVSKSIDKIIARQSRKTILH